MTSREFLKRELGDDLPDSLGSKICVLMDKYLEEMNEKVKTVRVTYGASGHWYEKKVGKTFKVIEYSEAHEAYLVDVPKYTGRFIYERDCELVNVEPTVIEMEKESLIAPDHYDNENGSLYLFSEQHKLNAWEFDIIKRIVRCREKGQFEEDLLKTKLVIDLYLSEYEPS